MKHLHELIGNKPSPEFEAQLDAIEVALRTDEEWRYIATRTTMREGEHDPSADRVVLEMLDHMRWQAKGKSNS